MKKIKPFIPASIFFLSFLFMLVGALTIDVKPIGVENSLVGFSKLNRFFFNILGEYTNIFYLASKGLTFLLLGGAIAFFVLKLIKIVKSKSLKAIDKDVYIMGVLFLILGLTYVIFEIIPINYRPVDLGEGLENSFPSSHTMLAISISGIFTIYEIKHIKESNVKFFSVLVTICLGLGVVFSRTLSNAHWLTDVVAGFLFGLTLTFVFYGITKTKDARN